ncbi:chromosomal replication initiator protein DnaA [Rhodoligotrophos defluvii]|uniref:chromosomal replication initiator protein DnaA n=1 Tax=Rhodoligotrophos defluvii TaxID=2561934 RepID=UPI001EF15043|nr:chromosomal replication initiator protein DnaA [Rhodoligotrophos defluvii]
MAFDESRSGDLAAAWGRISDRLRAELGEDLFSSWFARMEIEERSGARLVVSVSTQFLRNWVQSHYLDKLVMLADAELGGIKEVQIRVRSRGTPVRIVRSEASGESRQPSQKAAANISAVAPVSQAQRVPAASAAASDSDGRTASGGGLDRGSPLDPDLTFDTFLLGKSNALAHAAAMRVADACVDAPVSFNPLYIHSPSGFGKTHLLNAIAWRVRETQPERRVMFLSAERFMYHFITAIRARDVILFKDQFQSVDVLLVDDFQFLQGKTMLQEFLHTFNSLVDSKRQVIVAADVPPTQLDSIDARMRSRLAGGLIVDIQPPELELRRRILHARLIEAIRRDPSVAVPDDVVEFIANRVNGGGRELEGALIRVIAHQQLVQAPMSVDLAASALRDLVQSAEVQRIKIDDIMRVVGRHYNVAKVDLLSPRRARSIVRPRQVGMYLAKRLTSRSLPEIGRRFGGRDHSTVLHAVRKVEELLQKDEQLQREIVLLTKLLEQP